VDYLDYLDYREPSLSTAESDETVHLNISTVPGVLGVVLKVHYACTKVHPQNFELHQCPAAVHYKSTIV
jgi:hypothetical protein